jgi:predicted nucleic acid-binding protein
VILVDTSVWIEILNGRLAARLVKDDLLRFVTCGPIAQEILQGLREGAMADGFRDAFLAIPRLSDPLGWTTFMEAAEIYRLGRKSGYTIRSSIDCLIAAVAIENNVPVWHKDRDFSFIARYTRLRAFDQP